MLGHDKGGSNVVMLIPQSWWSNIYKAIGKYINIYTYVCLWEYVDVRSYKGMPRRSFPRLSVERVDSRVFFPALCNWRSSRSAAKVQSWHWKPCLLHMNMWSSCLERLKPRKQQQQQQIWSGSIPSQNLLAMMALPHTGKTMIRNKPWGVRVAFLRGPNLLYYFCLWPEPKNKRYFWPFSAAGVTFCKISSKEVFLDF